MAKATIVYYEPVEVTVGPVRLLALRKTRVEEVGVGRVSEDVSKLEERLAAVVERARKRGRNMVIEARLSTGKREAYYAESTLEGVEALLYYRPARLTAVTVVREGEGGRLLPTRHAVDKELYVYEGWVWVRDPTVRFVIIETVDGKRLLRRGEFHVEKR